MAIINVEADFTLLGRQFISAFKMIDGEEGGKKYLFAPKEGTEPIGMSIEDFEKDIQTLINGYSSDPEEFPKGEIASKLEQATPETAADNDWYKKVKLYVDQAFLYYKETPAPQPTKNDGPKKEFQYAIQISLRSPDGFPDTGLFGFNRFSLAIWNCDIEKILDSLQIFDIDEYIEG